jgi:hypothetical protein
MRGVEGKTGKRRFSASYVLLILSAVTYLASWAYSSYAAEWRAKAESPRIDPILKIIKGIRQYHQARNTFPQTFFPVEEQVWKHKVRPDYGAGGRSLVVSNYYYLYTPINATRCTLWAIPVGPRHDDANTFFVVLLETDREKWKGPALDLKEASTISGNPTYAELAMLGMVRQESLPQKKR